MNKLGIYLITSSSIVGILHAAELSTVENFQDFFVNGNVSGNVRAISAGYSHKRGAEDSTFSSAIGTTIKYELASYKGLNAGVAFTTSNDISQLGANNANTELSSAKGEYTQLNEAYINYTFEGLNLRAGRQVIDTPLADSDDYLMIANTFKAYTAMYEFSDITLMAGNIQSWQGTDAGIDDGWIDITKGGVNFVGVTYSNQFDASVWYYDIPLSGEENRAFYTDISYEFKVSENSTTTLSMQYLNEKELRNSGVQADIYGAMLESQIDDIGLIIGYNKSKKNRSKRTFSALGGGALYTSSYIHIIDDIAADRAVHSFVLGVNRSIGKANFAYSYFNFDGMKNSFGDKAVLSEHDYIVEYSINDDFLVNVVYSISTDKTNAEKTLNDWNRYHLGLNYNF